MCPSACQYPSFSNKKYQPVAVNLKSPVPQENHRHRNPADYLKDSH